MGEATVTRKTGLFKGLRGEFKKVIWPSFPALMRQTWTVIIISLIVGLIVFGIDSMYTAGINLLY